MFIATNGKTIRTMVRIGATSDNPNHKTERNAQQIAGNVKRTMIQLSKKASTLRSRPINRPIAVPMSMEATRPSKIRKRVCPTTR